MPPIIHVERATGGADSHQGESRWINQPSSSVTYSEGKSDKTSTMVRAGTPSIYMRRRGVLPNGANLQISAAYKKSTVSSSSTIMSPPSTANISTIIFKSLSVHQDPAYLPNLTESNLAKLMEQLSYCIDCSSGLAPRPAMEISYFSDGSSSGSDFE